MAHVKVTQNIVSIMINTRFEEFSNKSLWIILRFHHVCTRSHLHVSAINFITLHLFRESSVQRTSSINHPAPLLSSLLGTKNRGCCRRNIINIPTANSRNSIPILDIIHE